LLTLVRMRSSLERIIPEKRHCFEFSTGCSMKLTIACFWANGGLVAMKSNYFSPREQHETELAEYICESTFPTADQRESSQLILRVWRRRELGFTEVTYWRS